VRTRQEVAAGAKLARPCAASWLTGTGLFVADPDLGSIRPTGWADDDRSVAPGRAADPPLGRVPTPPGI
jgi:hypothetical protein